jgi:ABC-2 type transport system ATP-binding protein
MMVAGELVAEGRPGQIKAEQKDRLIEFVVDQPQRASDLLKKDMDSWRVSLFGDRLHVITDDRNNEQTVRQKLKDGGINVVSAREARFSMEDVFISVVAQAQQRSMAARGH